MPGGVIGPMPETSRAKIAAIAPAVDIDALEFAIQNYSLTLQHDAEPGRAVQTKLGTIAERAILLRLELQTMSEEAQDALGDAIGVFDGVAFHQAMIADLTRLSGASRHAHNAVTVTEGRPPSARQAFVRGIASILERAGTDVNAKPNAALCQIVGLLLSDVGDCPTDVAALVRNSLRENPRTPA